MAKKKLSKLPKYPLVLVQWADSFGCGYHWRDTPEPSDAQLYMVTSVGYLLRETKQVVVLAPHLARETGLAAEKCVGDMTIPKGCIQSREVLRAK